MPDHLLPDYFLQDFCSSEQMDFRNSLIKEVTSSVRTAGGEILKSGTEFYIATLRSEMTILKEPYHENSTF